MIKYLNSIGFLVAVFLLGSAFINNPVQKPVSLVAQNRENIQNAQNTDSKLEAEVLPNEGVMLPINWADLGRQMTAAGVIDREKFAAIYSSRGGLDAEAVKFLDGANNGSVRMTKENSSLLLNLLWAFGLGNKNEILEKGEMTDKKYGGDPSRFASTGGWTLAKGQVMDHYSKHKFVALTGEQQERVESTSLNIYRPCCGNSTHFPDCNHGMAMLGLLQLMAARNVSEAEMYSVALAVNSYWFPDTYLTIAKYLQTKRGVSWNRVEAKEVLGADYSSAAGYRRILSEISPVQQKGGPGCGV